MSHVIEIPDDIYDKLAAYAERERRPIETALQEWLKIAAEQLATPEEDVVYDPTKDPLAPFIGAFDSAGQPPLEPHEHDLYFAREVDADDAK